jgi:hypothetical protein
MMKRSKAIVRRKEQQRRKKPALRDMSGVDDLAILRWRIHKPLLARSGWAVRSGTGPSVFEGLKLTLRRERESRALRRNAAQEQSCSS